MPAAIGQPLDRVDGKLKVTGKATYTADQKIPNLAHAILLTSTIAKGRIPSIDTGAAERVPGVLAIITHKTRIRLAKDPMKVDPGSPADRALQVFQDDRVYYGNQPIAVAVAETLEAAREAAARVKVGYAEEAPAVRLDQGLANAYIPEKAGGAGDPGQSHRGDVAGGLASAAVRLEEIYS